MPAWNIAAPPLPLCPVPLDSAVRGDLPSMVALWHPCWAYSRYQLKDLADPKGALGKGEQLAKAGNGKEDAAVKQWAEQNKQLVDSVFAKV